MSLGPPSPGLGRPTRRFPRSITFGRLEAVSFTHSAIYVGLLVCAFAAGKPEPATLILGLSHGLVWIGMSLVCIAAARAGVIPYWLAVTIAVLGGLGPFAGSAGFVIEARRRHRQAPFQPLQLS
jgi:hypothetical protein